MAIRQADARRAVIDRQSITATASISTFIRGSTSAETSSSVDAGPMLAEVALAHRIDRRAIRDVGEKYLHLHDVVRPATGRAQYAVQMPHRDLELLHDVAGNVTIGGDPDSTRDPELVAGPYAVAVVAERLRLNRRACSA